MYTFRRKSPLLPVLLLSSAATLIGCVNISFPDIAPSPAKAPAAMPTITPAGGNFSSTQTVALADTTPGATIHFTTDGTPPTSSSPTYTTPLQISTSQTIGALATAPGFLNSPVAVATFSISIPLPTTAAPTFTPPAGTYTAPLSVTLADTAPNASIFYTTDGTTPTAASTPYTEPIPVSANQTITAIATANGFQDSASASAAYQVSPTPNLDVRSSHLALDLEGRQRSGQPAGGLQHAWSSRRHQHAGRSRRLCRLQGQSGTLLALRRRILYRFHSELAQRPLAIRSAIKPVDLGEWILPTQPAGRLRNQRSRFPHQRSRRAHLLHLLGRPKREYLALRRSRSHRQHDRRRLLRAQRPMAVYPATHQWTWMSGTDTDTSFGIFGIQGTPAATNVPSGRNFSGRWIDSNGDLWLFAGEANTPGPIFFDYPVNDFWRFQIATGLWTWMGGSTHSASTGTYGELGVPSSTNIPGARDEMTTWTDAQGNFWLFGGDGFALDNDLNNLNDLWRYQP